MAVYHLADITTLVEAWNAKNDALAKRREAAVAQS